MNIEQIAQLARVSTATVSRAINGSSKVREKTAERIRKVIAEVGYVPNQSARTLSSGRSQLFGVIISDITNPFFPELISSFERLCVEKSYDTIFANTNYDVQRLHQCLVRMIERRVDGIAVFTSEMDEASEAMLLRHKIPVVTLAYGVANSVFHTVRVDYRPGIGQAIQHLLQLGHTDIAFIAGPSELWSARRRLEIFHQTMSREHLHLPQERIVEGDNRLEGGMIAMRKLLALERRPTCVVCSNDLMAMGAFKAVTEAGLHIPSDLSLIGFDDLPIASLASPPLSSIQIPLKDMANRAFQMLWDASRDPHLERREYVLKTKLIIRHSTAAFRSPKKKAPK